MDKGRGQKVEHEYESVLTVQFLTFPATAPICSTEVAICTTSAFFKLTVETKLGQKMK
jgi:hypothetical protein